MRNADWGTMNRTLPDSYAIHLVHSPTSDRSRRRPKRSGALARSGERSCSKTRSGEILPIRCRFHTTYKRFSPFLIVIVITPGQIRANGENLPDLDTRTEQMVRICPIWDTPS